MDIDKLIAHVRWAEGEEKFPYLDSVGKITIGVGRNLEDKGLSNDEIELLLRNDIAEAISEAESFFWFEDLDDNRKIVVVDMIFNMGKPKFLGFAKTIAALSAGDYATAADEMTDSRWYRQTGRRARKLVKVMQTGEMDR